MTNVSTAHQPIRMIDPHVFDQTVERLCSEFDGRFLRVWVAQVVRRCVDDLAGNPPGAMPELGERLARQRLLGAGPVWSDSTGPS
ncbi:hypothetical protein [Nocardia sp. NPDC049149]|uniref:hypothetical protein n=1 Tax=Nocardia sp. NPDC049149 TaxID=3364315 RepID=UPI0037146677